MITYTDAQLHTYTLSFPVFQRKENSVTEDVSCMRYIHTQSLQTQQWERGNEKAVTVCPMSESVHRGVEEQDKIQPMTYGACASSISSQ